MQPNPKPLRCNQTPLRSRRALSHQTKTRSSTWHPTYTKSFQTYKICVNPAEILPPFTPPGQHPGRRGPHQHPRQVQDHLKRDRGQGRGSREDREGNRRNPGGLPPGCTPRIPPLLLHQRPSNRGPHVPIQPGVVHKPVHKVHRRGAEGRDSGGTDRGSQRALHVQSVRERVPQPVREAQVDVQPHADRQDPAGGCDLVC
jgi:hypothetical protein